MYFCLQQLINTCSLVFIQKVVRFTIADFTDGGIQMGDVLSNSSQLRTMLETQMDVMPDVMEVMSSAIIKPDKVGLA